MTRTYDPEYIVERLIGLEKKLTDLVYGEILKFNKDTGLPVRAIDVSFTKYGVISSALPRYTLNPVRVDIDFENTLRQLHKNGELRPKT